MLLRRLMTHLKDNALLRSDTEYRVMQNRMLFDTELLVDIDLLTAYRKAEAGEDLNEIERDRLSFLYRRMYNSLAWECAQVARGLTPQFPVEPGATVILGTEHAPIENGAIAIEGDRIVWVGRAEDADRDDSLVIDLKDRFVVPGFFDMHAHVQAGMERPLLAFGITTIRNPGSSGSEGIPFRNRLNTGDLLGPRMYTAGPTIDNAAKFDLTAGQQAVGDTGVGMGAPAGSCRRPSRPPRRSLR